MQYAHGVAAKQSQAATEVRSGESWFLLLVLLFLSQLFDAQGIDFIYEISLHFFSYLHFSINIVAVVALLSHPSPASGCLLFAASKSAIANNVE